ncbi:guanylate kinase [bacterium]|jgi:guanylate kinase|nr:guanylate kinase [bacterium]
MSKLFILSAPSGAGKTTLCSRLLEEFPDQLVLSISSTTRKPRGQEKDKVEYHFIGKDDFERQIKIGRFAEWALVHGNYYGTSMDQVDHAFNAGKSLLLDIDVQGAHSLRQKFKSQCVTFFIAPPNFKALEERLRKRGTETETSILKRLENAQHEMKQAPLFDHQILNDDLDQAFQELKTIVAGHLKRGSTGGKT